MSTYSAFDAPWRKARPVDAETHTPSFVPTPEDFTTSVSPIHDQTSFSAGSPALNSRGAMPLTGRSALRTTASGEAMRSDSAAGTLSSPKTISIRSRCLARTIGSRTRNVSSEIAKAGKRLGFACSDISSPLPRSSFLYQ